MSKAHLHAVVKGRVQGVYFRAFVRDHALRLGLTGWARNLPEGDSVEVDAEGDRDKLEELERLLWVGPPGAQVHWVECNWAEAADRFTTFRVG